MAKRGLKYLNILGLKFPIIGKIVDDENGQPLVVYTKKNPGRKDTSLPVGTLPKPDPSSDDGIWYDQMTDEQKKEYGIFKASEKKKKKDK